jgi:hypothetical protein
VAGALWWAPTAGAQAAPAQPVAEPDRPVAAAERARVVAGVLDSLRAAYVFPDAVAGMAAAVHRHARRGAYDGLTARALADSLTAHLRAARRDGHLRVAYRPTSMAPPPPAADSAAVRAERARERAAAERANHGVHRVERLAGNVGYLALHAFAEPEGAGPALAAAMTLLAHTDALILDLRANGGGYPPTADLVASYLLDARPVHLLSFYHRPTDRTFDSWSLAAVPGPRYGAARPVYVLTSRATASAAEALAYTLRHLGRATVVGDTTGGHAHPGGYRDVGGGFAVFVPDGRPTSPVTRGNWEGVGVVPNVVTPAAGALPAAHVAALRALLGAARDPERRRELDAALAEASDDAHR